MSSFPAYIFTSLAQAQAAVAAMDAPTAFGPYPKAGANIGGGIHAPAAQSQTLTYGAIWQNVAATQWAYVQDANSGALLPTKIPVPGVQTISFDPGGNWEGAVKVWP